MVAAVSRLASVLTIVDEGLLTGESSVFAARWLKRKTARSMCEFYHLLPDVPVSSGKIFVRLTVHESSVLSSQGKALGTFNFWEIGSTDGSF